MSQSKLVFLILIIAAIGSSVYFLFLKSENKKPPEPLLASEATILWIDGKTLSVLFKIENPNKYYASDNYSYSVNLYNDHDEIVKSVQKTLFIYASETETLTEAKIDTGGNIISRAEIAINDINWIPAPDFTRPDIKIENLEAAKENNSYVVRAKIYNPNDFDISKIIFNAVLYTKAGQELAVVRQDSDLMKAQRSKGLISYVNINPSMQQYLDLSTTKFYIYIKK